MAVGWLKDLFGGKIVKDVGDVVDNLSTSVEEKRRVKNELAKIVFDGLGRLQDAQRDVLVTELSGSKLQRSWRPILMIAFGAIVVLRYGIYPILRAFMHELPELPELLPDFWGLLKIGIGGYIIGRSTEKVADKVTANVDLGLLKKRDRDDIIKEQYKAEMRKEEPQEQNNDRPPGYVDDGED